MSDIVQLVLIIFGSIVVLGVISCIASIYVFNKFSKNFSDQGKDLMSFKGFGKDKE